MQVVYIIMLALVPSILLTGRNKIDLARAVDYMKNV